MERKYEMPPSIRICAYPVKDTAFNVFYVKDDDAKLSYIGIEAYQNNGILTFYISRKIKGLIPGETMFFLKLDKMEGFNNLGEILNSLSDKKDLVAEIIVNNIPSLKKAIICGAAGTFAEPSILQVYDVCAKTDIWAIGISEKNISFGKTLHYQDCMLFCEKSKILFNCLIKIRTEIEKLNSKE